MMSTKPVVDITALNCPFFEGTKQGELRVQECLECAEMWYPPAGNCPSCLSRSYTWRAVSGRGTVWSWIVIHRRYLQGFDDEIPYPVGLVQLDEGPLILARILGAPEQPITCDAPVGVVFAELTQEISIPAFALDANSSSGER
jgi:uncharacterized OB-fold protein